jgi:hypothetical protein
MKTCSEKAQTRETNLLHKQAGYNLPIPPPNLEYVSPLIGQKCLLLPFSPYYYFTCIMEVFIFHDNFCLSLKLCWQGKDFIELKINYKV